MKLHDALVPYAAKYSASFLRAMEFVLSWECVFARGHQDDYGYVISESDSDDSGGVTKWGVDQRSHPRVNVAHLTLPDALAIYHDDEWTAIRGDDLPEDVAIVTFDAAVNVGTSKAAKWLQATVSAEPDGNIGPRTVAAVQAHQGDLLGPLLGAREEYYRDIGHGRLHGFLAGWTNRVNALRDYFAVI